MAISSRVNTLLRRVKSRGINPSNERLAKAINKFTRDNSGLKNKAANVPSGTISSTWQNGYGK